MKKKTFIFLSCLLLISTFGCSKDSETLEDSLKKGYELDESALIKQGYAKIFEDNFSSDLSKWISWEGGAYNNELQLYQQKNLKIENGNLVITPVKEQVVGKVYPETSDTKTFSYTSGRIDSKFTYKASVSTPKIRISARIKLPLGAGMWPAFWSVGDIWPTKGEIDILEALGTRYNYTTDYFYGHNPGVVDTDDEFTVKNITSPTDLTEIYHVYEVIWTKNSLTFLLDGKVVDEKLSTSEGGEVIPAFYEKLQHLTLNLAVGGDIFGLGFDNSTIKTAPMYIDWVRVYSSQ